MIPVVTPQEMTAIDAAAPEAVETLIHRAGGAVARAAIEMMGGTYGRHVIVIVGGGNNGRDGLDAARRLARRGVSTRVIDAGAPWPGGGVDLVIDAAYGTGLRRGYVSPIPTGPGRPSVLAVDIPSGLDGLTGAEVGAPARADLTVTFAALKPGLLIGHGPDLCGDIRCVDIGLDVGAARSELVEEHDVAALFVRRDRTAHKWAGAIWVIGGSAGMEGAPALAVGGALAAGAGYVRVSSPGHRLSDDMAVEAVHRTLPMIGWHHGVVADIDRIAAVVVGPGLGRDDSVRDEVCGLATAAEVPMVIDGDGLWAIAELKGRMADAPRVITPHDGEYTYLTGAPPGSDRLEAARRLAAMRSAVVVLKGPTTVVAEPGGRCRLVTAGDERLATAGTGDVLSGVIGALLGAGMDGFDAAAIGCEVHALAARRCAAVGMVASALPPAVSAVLTDLVGPRALPAVSAR